MFRLALLIASCVALTACSLIVQFDPNMQPCDEAGLCGPNAVCVNSLCKFNDGGLTFDAGVDAGNCAARETRCTDGLDDDCDGVKDCADGDCAGQRCEDGDPCTVGETCVNNACPRGAAKDCSAPSTPCQTARGTCSPDSGVCLYGALPEGTSCGSTVGARCCGGACINTSVNSANCGGCGIACGTGQLCQSINQSSCATREPVDTSGRCSCSAGVPCPMGQSCVSGFCVPVLPSHCATGENIAMSVGCQPYCRY